MFNSDKEEFYKKAGFIPMKNVTVLKGDPKKPIKDDGIAFMLFLSEKGKNEKKDFEKYPVYFGSSTW